MIQSTESADRIRELLEWNLQQVFGEGDAARRRAAIEELWAEDGILYVPPGAIVGHAAIDSFAGDLRTDEADDAAPELDDPQLRLHARFRAQPRARRLREPL